MDIFERAERLMGMDEAAWARHANPWSGYTRFACLPLTVLAIWSRVWIGWWCLVPLALALAWTWANPRVFPPPARLDAWASRGVLGERLFLARAERPIPEHHRRWGLGLSWLSAAGAVPMIWGLAMLDPVLTLAGMALTMLAKLWFVDRMVWLHADMTGGQGSGQSIPP